MSAAEIYPVYIVTGQGEYGEWYEIVSVHSTREAADRAREAYSAGLGDGTSKVERHEVSFGA